MNKKSLLSLMLLCFAFFGLARATEVEIGDGGTSSNQYLPGYNFYNYSYTQQIYTADEIGMAGTINSIAFKNTGAEKTRTYNVYMTLTDKETFSSNTDWVAISENDLVFAGSLTFTVGEWTTIDLTTPFTYDGTSNLLVSVRDMTGSYTSSPHMACLVFSASSQAIRAYRDSSAYDITAPGVSGSVLSVKNQIVLDITSSGGATCDKPSTLEVTDITGYDATCTWENTGAASYTFEWKKASDSDYTVVTNLTANTYALNNLEPFTAYSVRVKAVCGEGLESGYKTANFSTLDVCPEGKVCIGQGTATNAYLPTYNYYNYSYTQQIYTAEEIGMAGLIESVDIYSVGSVTRNLEIYMLNTEKVTFDSVTDWIPVTEGDLVFSGQVAFAANSWNTMEFNSPFIFRGRNNVVLVVRDITGSYVSSINFFVFDADGNQAIRAYRDTPGAYDIAAPGVNGTLMTVKNRVRFGMSELPSCLQPSGVTVSNIAARTAEVSWTENGEATDWDIDVNGIVTAISQNPYTLVDLEPETDYTVKVRANCGGDDYSEWSAAVTFTTDVSCHTPTNLAVSDITAFTANLNWTNTETTYELRYVANPNYLFQGFVTDPGAMSDGSDASWLKGSESTFGPGVQQTTGNMLADDFTVYSTTALTEIEVYGYQTGSTTESTFTGLYVQIYDGNPAEEGSTVVWGNMETNIMTSTSFTNCYRGTDGDVTGMTRPIMAITASRLNIDLEPGTYWLVYNLAGSGSSGPWGVPYCEPGIGMTGDGLQYLANNSAWQALENGGKTYGPAMKLLFGGDIETLDWTYVDNIEANTYAMTNLDPVTDYLVQVRATCGGNDGNSEWATTKFTTLPTCLAPTDLVVSEIEARQVVLSWIENGTATAWQIGYQTVEGEEQYVEVSENPYTLTGLIPDTHYLIRVQAKCSDTDYSVFTDFVSFTTDVSCYAPTDLTYTDITRTSATIGWTSDNDNFELWYREHAVGGILTTNFDDSNMNGWTTIDADNDGFTWVLGSEIGGVYLVTTGSLAGSGHNSSADLVCSGSYRNLDDGNGVALTPDNYLVSPQVALGGSITFWACGQDASYVAEHFGVAVSTTGNTSADDFTTIQEWTMTAKSRGASDAADNAYINKSRGGNRDQGTWYEFTVDLSEYSGMGYVAIRHFNCTDMFILNVDDIVIEQPAAGVSVEWIEVSNATNPYTITGLNPETTYDVQVRSNCGDYDGYSTWLTGSFTTAESCPAPVALAATPYAKSAVLSWEGTSESYTVKYGIIEIGETIFSEDFAEGIPADWTNDATYPWEVVDGYIQSSNGGVASSSSTISFTLSVSSDAYFEFDAQCMGEGTSTIWDKCIFTLDGTEMFRKGQNGDQWDHYRYPITAGTHTFTWSYQKDGSVNPTGDYMAVDNIAIVEKDYVWETTTATTNECTITDLTPLTTYYAQVMGDCGNYGTSEWSEIISFTTLELTTVTQTLELEEGWNWVSLYVTNEDPIELLDLLKAALGENATQINASEMFTEYEDGEWFGDLDEEGIFNEQTYMIYVNTACTVEIEGEPADLEDYIIEINPDWNWIGFPSTEVLDINEALADFEAEEGDLLLSSTDFSEFDGEEWYSDTFIELAPGQGYLYFSNSDETKYLVFRTGAGNPFPDKKQPVKVKVTNIKVNTLK